METLDLLDGAVGLSESGLEVGDLYEGEGQRSSFGEAQDESGQRETARERSGSRKLTSSKNSDISSMGTSPRWIVGPPLAFVGFLPPLPLLL